MPARYVTLQQIEDRHPAELIKLAADEQTGVRDDARIEAAIDDASTEVRTILKARYSVDDLSRLDADSLDALRIYTIDIALYRIALTFSRSTERIEERYKAAIKRLEAIASGKGELTLEGGAAGSGGSETDSTITPNEVVIDAPDRIFTRRRLRGI